MGKKSTHYTTKSVDFWGAYELSNQDVRIAEPIANYGDDAGDVDGDVDDGGGCGDCGDGDGTGVDDGHIVIAMEKRHEPSDFNITFVYVQDVATYGIIPWW